MILARLLMTMAVCLPIMAAGQADIPRSAFGQSIMDSQSQPADTFQTRKPQSYSDEYAIASPADDDIGLQQIFKREQDMQPFSAFAEVAGYYTSNAFLNNFFELEDAYLATRVGLGYSRRLTGPFFVDMTLRQQWFRYDKYSELDFESLRGEASLLYVLPPFPDASLFVRYGYERLTDGREHNEFYVNHGVAVGVQAVKAFSRGHRVFMSLTSELAADTEPEIISRDEYSLNISYSVDLTRSLRAMLTYRVAYQHYPELSRHDWNHLGDLNFQYSITRNISLSASVTCTANRSNNDLFDYDVANLGAGLGVLIRF